MNRSKKLSLIALPLLMVSHIAWAVTIDLNPFIHVRGSGVSYSPYLLNLGPGQYDVTPTIGAYTAFSPWDINIDCNPSCVGEAGVHQGYGHYFGIIIDGTEIVGRDDTSSGFFYHDPNDAFANAVQNFSFTLSGTTDVEFFIPTGFSLLDNRGGISLAVSAVPIPPTLFLFGSGILGLFGVGCRAKSKKNIA